MNRIVWALVLSFISSAFFLSFVNSSGTAAGMATSSFFDWVNENPLTLIILFFGGWLLVLHTYSMIMQQKTIEKDRDVMRQDQLLWKELLDKVIVEDYTKPISERHMEPREVYVAPKKESPVNTVLKLFKK